jgi:hypothetical protein
MVITYINMNFDGGCIVSNWKNYKLSCLLKDSKYFNLM